MRSSGSSSPQKPMDSQRSSNSSLPPSITSSTSSNTLQNEQASARRRAIKRFRLAFRENAKRFGRMVRDPFRSDIIIVAKRHQDSPKQRAKKIAERAEFERKLCKQRLKTGQPLSVEDNGEGPSMVPAARKEEEEEEEIDEEKELEQLRREEVEESDVCWLEIREILVEEESSPDAEEDSKSEGEVDPEHCLICTLVHRQRIKEGKRKSV